MGLYEIARKLKRKLDPVRRAPTSYAIGDYKISLPAEHLLPRYQQAHPLYDRFILSIGAVDFDGWLIDIGANVGDSAAALASGRPKHLLCIEPDDQFFAGLEETATSIRSRGSTVICVKTLVGPAGARADIARSDTTASVVLGGGASHAMSPLDQIVEDHIPPDARIDLIKCDVDGFDAVALDSGRALISRFKPLLFVEAEIKTADGLDQWRDTLNWLTGQGYDSFAAFDNFGLLILKDVGASVVLNLLEYTYRLNQGRSARTVFYFDLFAAAPQSNAQYRAALEIYNADWLA